MLLSAAVAVALVGCTRSDLPTLGDVNGVVTLDGNPLPEAVVNFTPTSGGRPSTGTTDENGYYSLLYLEGVDGAIVGEHAVTVEPITTEEMDDYDEENPEAGGTPPPQLPDSAYDGSIKKEVAEGSNEIDIELSNASSE
ncbi:carboxypeptidase-like regulatory domain-containing protein [Maioricimonas rarisocia]|nr:carboxypeptidase-like regulatory domain-containing protein [Maioricimonas rarisocia]